jgi:hypothetical protein
VILLQCPSRLVGERLCKSLAFLSCINGPKRAERTWKIMKEMIVQEFEEPMKMLKSAESDAFR